MSEMFPKAVARGMFVNVSREMLLGQGLIEPTEAEAAEAQASRERWAASRREAREMYDVAIPKLDAITDPVARRVLDLHAPSQYGLRHECAGCDYSGFDAEAPEWPCETVRTVAEMFDIFMPGDMSLSAVMM